MKRILLLTTLVLFATPVYAQAPDFVPVQGFLTSQDGQPINGETVLHLGLYETDMGGSAVFAETHTVLVDNGFFVLYLGAIETLDLNLFRDHGSLFLGIAVGAEAEMVPRLSVGSVPFAGFAQYAGDAQTLQGQTVADFRAVGDTVEWDDLANVPSDLVDGDSDALSGLSCGNGQVVKWDATNTVWACGDDNDNGTQLTEADLHAMLDDDYLAATWLPDWAQIQNMPSGFADNVDDDTQLTEPDLHAMLDDDYHLAAWLPDWAQVQNIPPGFADNVDDDTQLTEPELHTMLDDDYRAATWLPDWAQVQNIPSGFADNVDDDTQLTEADLHTMLDADYLPSTWLPSWIQLQDIPAGFADNVDNDTQYGATAPVTLAGGQFGIGSNSITAAYIDADAVGNSELASNAVGSSEIINGAIGVNDLGTDSVNSSKIMNGTILATDTDPSSVQSRVDDSCAAGNYMRQINQDGSVVCDPETAAPGSQFTVAGGMDWVENGALTGLSVTFITRGLQRMVPGYVGLSNWSHTLPIPRRMGGRTVTIDTIELNYLCTAGDFIADTFVYSRANLTTHYVFGRDMTDYYDTGTYFIDVSSSFSDRVNLETEIYTDDVNGYCQILWKADYHY